MGGLFRYTKITPGSVLAVALVLGMTLPARAEPLLPVPFQMTEAGQMRDPTGLWSPAEVAEGGSLLRDHFGGSVVFIDNGPSSDAFENPSSDFIAAMRLDPMFAAAVSDGPSRVTDGEDYLAALEMFWQQIYSLNRHEAGRLLARGGWIDGCGDRY